MQDAATAEDVRAIFQQAREGAFQQRATATTASEKPEVGKGNGVMLAFFLSPDTARTLAVPGGEPPDDMHITLAILGTVDDFTPTQLRELKRFVGGFASEATPLRASTDGVHRFPTNPQSGQYAVYAGVDAPGIQQWRAALVKRLTGSGFPVDNRFPDYKPHVTLTYVKDGESSPITSAPDLSFPLDRLTLAVGGDRYDFPVGDEQYPQERSAASAQPDPIGQLAAALAARLDALTETRLREMRTLVLDALGSAQ